LHFCNLALPIDWCTIARRRALTHLSTVEPWRVPDVTLLWFLAITSPTLISLLVWYIVAPLACPSLLTDIHLRLDGHARKMEPFKAPITLNHTSYVVMSQMLTFPANTVLSRQCLNNCSVVNIPHSLSPELSPHSLTAPAVRCE
jgi:hypothetical protein